METTEEEGGLQQSYDSKELLLGTVSEAFSEDEDTTEDIRTYGTEENLKNLKKNLSKLILCVEMENWEKAEMFMEIIRQLTGEAPPEVKRMALRLKMAIQKEDYEKVSAAFGELNNFL